MQGNALRALSAITVLGAIGLIAAVFAFGQENHPRFAEKASAASVLGCGDVDGDGFVHLIDAVIAVDHYFVDSPDPDYAVQADLDKDGNGRVADILGVVNQFDAQPSCQPSGYPNVTPVPGGRFKVDANGESTAYSPPDPINPGRMVAVGDTFHITVHITENPGIVGYQARVGWTGPITFAPRDSLTNDVFLDNTGPGDARQAPPVPMTYLEIEALDINASPWNSTTYTGPVMQLEFTCDSVGVANFTLGGAGHTAMADEPTHGTPWTYDTYNSPNISTGTEVKCVDPIVPFPDPDGDGIETQIDLSSSYSSTFSDMGSPLFGTTSGSVARNGMTVWITDRAPNPFHGVRIIAFGSGGPAKVIGCAGDFKATLFAGTDIVKRCASADIVVNAGSPIVTFYSLIARLEAGADVSVTEPSPGVYDVANNGGSAVTVGGVAIAGGGSANGLVDTDTDGLADSAEPALGTNANDADSDNDGVEDGPEVVEYGTDPLAPDTDGDGCTEGQELGPDELDGGQRNPLDPDDYFNPSQDGLNRVDDILLVVQAYFDDDNDGTPGMPPYVAGYNPLTDRSNMAASPNAWNTGAPDGLQRVQDIIHAVNSYFHDCA